MARAKKREPANQPRLNVGDVFKPYMRFNNLLVPEQMGRFEDLNPGAKLVYGALRRYAGENGECWPSVPTLAKDVGLGPRMVQKHLRALEDAGFIRRIPWFKGPKDQTSNRYVFLWHAIFDMHENDGTQGDELRFTPLPANSGSSPRVHRRSPVPVHSGSYKEGHTEEGHIQEGRPGSLPANIGQASWYADSDE